MDPCPPPAASHTGCISRANQLECEGHLIFFFLLFVVVTQRHLNEASATPVKGRPSGRLSLTSQIDDLERSNPPSSRPGLQGASRWGCAGRNPAWPAHAPPPLLTCTQAQDSAVYKQIVNRLTPGLSSSCRCVPRRPNPPPTFPARLEIRREEGQ